MLTGSDARHVLGCDFKTLGDLTASGDIKRYPNGTYCGISLARYITGRPQEPGPPTKPKPMKAKRKYKRKKKERRL